MALVLKCDQCGTLNWNLAAAGQPHARPADEVKGYDACDGHWRQSRFPELRLVVSNTEATPPKQTEPEEE